jgi:hypothetical protein
VRRRAVGGVVRLAGAYAQNPQDVGDEDFAVAHLAGFRGTHDGFHDLIDELILDGDFDAGLGHEIDDVFRAAVQLRVASLASEALDLGHRHARHPNFGERRAHVIELEGLDNGSNQFHSGLRSTLGRPPNTITIVRNRHGHMRPRPFGGPQLPFRPFGAGSDPL